MAVVDVGELQPGALDAGGVEHDGVALHPAKEGVQGRLGLRGRDEGLADDDHPGLRAGAVAGSMHPPACERRNRPERVPGNAPVRHVDRALRAASPRRPPQEHVRLLIGSRRHAHII